MLTCLTEYMLSSRLSFYIFKDFRDWYIQLYIQNCFQISFCNNGTEFGVLSILLCDDFTVCFGTFRTECSGSSYKTLLRKLFGNLHFKFPNGNNLFILLRFINKHEKPNGSLLLLTMAHQESNINKIFIHP